MSAETAWRATPFRLALAFGAAFGVGVAMLLAVVYVEAADFLTRRVDRILAAETRSLETAGPEQILRRVSEPPRDPLSSAALYASSGERLAGSARPDPGAFGLGEGPREFALAGGGRVRAERTPLPWGETLVVARDIGQLAELRRLLTEALIGSGAAIVVLGVAAGVVLSLEPLRRVRSIRAASVCIAAGDLTARLPLSGRRDEIDALARIVNDMLEEVERLVQAAQTAGESVAHELRTPLTRLRASLERTATALPVDSDERGRLEACVAEADVVLSRFQSLLRISAVEARRRGARIRVGDLSTAVRQMGELYEPLAEERGILLLQDVCEGLFARLDEDLFTEALANLLDNALKFTPAGGRVELTLVRHGSAARLEVRDDGSGVAERDLPLITQRFYRAAAHHAVEGHGLGLSLVAAVVRMHGFVFSLENAHPGLRARIEAPLVAPPA